MAALRRIFKICDTNKDGVLDAAELNEFQVCQSHGMILIFSAYIQLAQVL